MLDRRTFVGGATAVAALSAAAGCGLAGSYTATEDSAALEGMLRYRIPSSVCLDPYGASSEAAFQVLFQLFDPLTRYDFATASAVGLAASSFEVSEDARRFTFHLVPGATFHNGEAVTAAAFKRAWERLADPASPAASALEDGGNARHLALIEGYDALRQGAAHELAGVTCPDDLTLEVALVEPYADFPVLVAHPVLGPVPASALEDPAGFAEFPVGNGPFCMDAAWNGDGDIDLVRFEGYVGAPAQLDGVSFVLTDDVAAAYKRLETDDLDVCEVPVEQVEEAEGALALSEDGCSLDADHRLLRAEGQTVRFLSCDPGQAPFDDAEIRRALSLAIDREGLCEKALSDACIPATGLAAPSVGGGAGPSWAACTFDADQARDILEVRYPADESGARGLEITLTHRSGGIAARIAEAIASDWQALGVRVTTEAVEWAELAERCRNGEVACCLAAWTPDYPVLDSVAFPLLHSASRAAGTNLGYADAEVDALLDEARATVDAAARAELAARALAIAGEACPVIPLAFDVTAVAVSERVASLYRDPQGRAHLADANLF